MMLQLSCGVGMQSLIKLIISFIGAAVAFMTSVGPDEAEANFYLWVRKLVPDTNEKCLPDFISGGTVQYTGAAVAIVFLVWFLLQRNPQIMRQVGKRFRNAEKVESVGGQLSGDTLEATGVLHGGKLELHLPTGAEDQRFTDVRNTESAIETDILISIYNSDFHETVSDVTVTLVSYGPADNPNIRYPAGIELECVTKSRNAHPRDQKFFKVGVLVDSKELRLKRSKSFWLGNKNTGILLEHGEYLLKVGYSGHNHSQKSEFFEIGVRSADISLGPKVKR